MSDYFFDKPIFIIGAARSGTTLLGEILSQHKDIAYWLEPKYIWRYNKPRSKHDERTANETSDKTIKYIRKRFYSYLIKNKKNRFLEKTPSNVFRVSFINKVFPNALFVVIIRDGRDVTLSAYKKWTSKPAKSAIIRRLSSNEIPLFELPFYGAAMFRDVLARFFLPKKGFIWGPTFKGMQAFRSKNSTIKSCAMQWLKSVSIANRDLEQLPKDRIFKMTYENLITNPESEISALLQFLGLKDGGLVKYAKETIYNTGSKKRSIESEKILEEVMPMIKEKLIELNYA